MEAAVEFRKQLKAAAGERVRRRRSTTSSSRPRRSRCGTSRAPTAPTATASSSSTRASTSASRSRARTRSSCPTIFDADQEGPRARSPPRPARLAERVREGKITPPELSARDVHDLEPRHVRHPPLRRRDQPAAGGDPRPSASSRHGRSCATARSWPRAMELTLACDHRILYGAEAAAFLGRDPRVPARRRCGSRSSAGAPEREFGSAGAGRGGDAGGLWSVLTNRHSQRAVGPGTQER